MTVNLNCPSESLMTLKKSRRLLVIDDDQTVLFALKRIFRKRDIVVDTSETLEEAKRLIDENHYDVILTDLRFSDVVKDAGIEITAYAKTRQPLVKVILWTGCDRAAIGEQARAAHVDFCFTKPLSPGVIRSILENLCLL